MYQAEADPREEEAQELMPIPVGYEFTSQRKPTGQAEADPREEETQELVAIASLRAVLQKLVVVW